MREGESNPKNSVAIISNYNEQDENLIDQLIVYRQSNSIKIKFFHARLSSQNFKT
jgi:hypothetical protein